MTKPHFFVEKRPKTGWKHLIFGLFIAVSVQNCEKEKIALDLTEQISPTKLDLTAIAFFDEKTGYAVGGDTWTRGEILATEDGSEHWRLDTVVEQKLWDVSFDPFGEAYSVGVAGRLFVKKLGYPGWEKIRQDWFFSRNCSFLSEKQGLVVAGEGFVNGRIQRLGPVEIWMHDQRDSFPQEISAVQWLDSLTAVACGYGLVVRSTDSGFSWERQGPQGDFFTALHFPTATTGFVVGKFGTILKSVDGGRSWANIRKGGRAGKHAANFNTVFFQNESIGFVAGDNGLFWKTTDGGDHWLEVENTPGDLDFTGISIKNNTGWLSATGGRIFRFQVK